jgi:hypothetical protein
MIATGQRSDRAAFSHSSYAFEGRTVLNLPRAKIRFEFFLILIEPGMVRRISFTFAPYFSSR